MGSKKLFLMLGLVVSTLLGGKIYATEEEKKCAENTGWYPGIESTTANTAIIQGYQLCLREAQRMQTEQINMPKNPGAPPVYDCARFNIPPSPPTQPDFDMCKGSYEANKARYDAELAAYNSYMADHSNMYTAKKLSAAQIIEDIAAKQQKAADRLKTIALVLKIAGQTMMVVGTLLIAGLFTSAAGYVVLGAGIVLSIISAVIEKKSGQILDQKVITCEQLNKILTKSMECNDVKEQLPVDGTFTPVNYGVQGTGGTSDIPPFIDGTTGKCKAPVTPECSAIVKNSPKDCFKANSKGMSCMAGIKNKPVVTKLSNGKFSMSINGKQRSFGAEDFADEASMMKAGFTSAQAKQFLNMTNDPNSILAKMGLDSKGELKAGTVIIPTASLSKSSALDGNGAGGTAGMNSKKDEYGPVQEVARTPTSAEGLTKDYHGDTIGAEGDNVFKMINRRYNLKQKQNIFIEQ